MRQDSRTYLRSSVHINEWLATLSAEMGNQKNKNKVRNRIKNKTIKRTSTLNGRLGDRKNIPTGKSSTG